MHIFQMPGTLESLDAETPILWDAGCLGLEEAGPQLKAYFAERVELPFAGEWLETSDEDWMQKWKEGIKPVSVGAFTVVPSWMTAEVPEGQRMLVIDPGMAFGTGHHATTQLAMRALQERDLQGKRVLDVGAGTGLLALVAASLGADAMGVDIDPITVPIARENAEINHLNIEFVEGILSDVLPRAPWDLLVCNLYAELHASLAHEYVTALAGHGEILLTGILAERWPLVERGLTEQGFGNIQLAYDGEWVLCTASR